MRLLRQLNTSLPGTGSCVAIGNFDGLHLGHQAIINKLVNKSKESGLPSVVLTFAPSPKQYFMGKAHQQMMRMQDKLATLQAMGVDSVIAMRFNQIVAQLSAEEFLAQYLVQRCQIKHLFVGEDFQFGKDRKGDVEFLKANAKSYGYQVKAIAKVEQQAARISSTAIRFWLKQGELELTAKALGHPFFISARVCHGDKRGRQIGVPTANINPRGICLPKQGVYAVDVILKQGQRVPGVCNIGVRPTVDGTKLSVETHLMGFEGNLYGQKIKIEFLKHIRDEKKFDSLDALKIQIEQDINHAKLCVHA